VEHLGQPRDAAGRSARPSGIAITSSTAVDDNVLLIHPSVAFAAGSYVIGWQDEYLTGVAVRRLGTDGLLQDAAPLTISSGALGQRGLSLAPSPDGTSVTAVYERFDEGPGTWRVFHRRLALECLPRP